MTVRTLRDPGIGVEVVARDRGPGIDDAPAALAGRLVGKGLGVGLAAVHRADDELDIDVRHLEGTCLTMRCWHAPPRPRPELALEGRPYPGEPRSGDDGLFVRTRTGFIAAVIDGLGHGPAARVASQRAADVMRENLDLALPDLLHTTHIALKGTRGCAMTLPRHHSGESTPAQRTMLSCSSLADTPVRWDRTSPTNV